MIEQGLLPVDRTFFSFSCMRAQLCLTLFDPIDCSSPGSSVHGFSRQEYWSGLPFPSPGDLPHLGIKPVSFISRWILYWWVTGKPFFFLKGYYMKGEKFFESEYFRETNNILLLGSSVRRCWTQKKGSGMGRFSLFTDLVTSGLWILDAEKASYCEHFLAMVCSSHLPVSFLFGLILFRTLWFL